MTRRLFWLATGVELLGIAIIGIGLGLEIAYGGHVYFLLITGGSVMVAAGGILFGKFIRRQK